MAIGVRLDFKGATLEQYDQVVERLGFLPGGPAPPEVLFHWVAKTDDGIRVTDVWRSKEDFEEFARQKMIGAFQEIGVTTPEIEFIEVHNYFVGGRRRG